MFEALAEGAPDTLESSGLSEKTYTMVRLAALIAMDSPPVSYDNSLNPARDILDIDDLRGVLIALAPVVGSARVASAVASILDVFFVDADDDETEGTSDDDDEYLDVEAAEHIDALAEDRCSGLDAHQDEEVERATAEQGLEAV